MERCRRCGTLGPRRARCQKDDAARCILKLHLSLLHDKIKNKRFPAIEHPIELQRKHRSDRTGRLSA